MNTVALFESVGDFCSYMNNLAAKELFSEKEMNEWSTSFDKDAEPKEPPDEPPPGWPADWD